MTIHIETFANDELGENRRRVTEGVFTYVAIDEKGGPIPVV
jgi:acyl-CoA hydrolase